MTKQFDSQLAFDPDRDVRDRKELVDRVRNRFPIGDFWPLVAPRRSGKTWTLLAIEHALYGKMVAKTFDFRKKNDANGFFDKDAVAVMLVDEPGAWFSSGAIEFNPEVGRTFLSRCEELRGRGTKIVVAMAPREYEFLLTISNSDLPKDCRFLFPLSAAEAGKMANRAAEWAPALLANLPALWRRNPFLLEVVFGLAEDDASLRADVDVLVEMAMRVLKNHTHKYRDSLFVEGLSESQRAMVRRIARRETVTEAEAELLIGCGLAMEVGNQLELADPILQNHLPPPLRIHHISDIHVGEKAEELVDVKAGGSIGPTLGEADDSPYVRDLYLKKVETLTAAGTGPHLVIISGDIAERGDDKLYADFKPWLARLESMLTPHPDLRAGEPRVLLVGGNHDVDWQQTLGVDGERKRHLPFAHAFNDYPRPRLEKPPEERSAPVVDYPQARLMVGLLGSAEFGGEVEEDPAWTRVADLVEKMRQEAADSIAMRDWELSHKLLGQIGRVDPGLVHERELTELKKAMQLRPVRIAVLHHPVSPLPYTEVARFAGLLNAGKVKEALFESNCCLVLHGHLHVGWFAEESWPERFRGWKLRIASAATLGSREKPEAQGFNEIRVLREGEECEVVVQRFRRDGGSFQEVVGGQLGPFVPGK